MRKTIQRNERTGQFSGPITKEISEFAGQMADDYFEKFNEVDIFDLIYIFESQLRHRGTFTLMKEIKENETK